MNNPTEEMDIATEVYIRLQDLLREAESIEAIDGPGGQIIRLEFYEGYKKGISISLEQIKEILERDRQTTDSGSDIYILFLKVTKP